MDFRRILNYICQLLWLVQVNYHTTQGKPSTILTNQRAEPTKINQITTPIEPSRPKSHEQRKKNTKGKKIPLVKEFPLQHLINIGLTSNEANTFIRGKVLKGKSLEVQYERTRENDMNEIEEGIFFTQNQLKLLIKNNTSKKKELRVRKMKKRTVRRKVLSKEDLMRRQLGFI
ncbi:uncharacterized protein [Clytia hemisphaerica]|uniref:Cnidarian restricted protein n=1 Tax=Clytia hemisphaerica TaxID=252671 RepID=A0A7M6DQ98_9CNID|eukprot:TCONS_00008117-protein